MKTMSEHPTNLNPVHYTMSDLQVRLYVLGINKVTISLPDINIGKNIRLCSPLVYKVVLFDSFFITLMLSIDLVTLILVTLD